MMLPFVPIVVDGVSATELFFIFQWIVLGLLIVVMAIAIVWIIHHEGPWWFTQ